jgi:hypothetical protein
VDEFPYLADHGERLSRLSAPLTDEEAVELLCSDCPLLCPDEHDASSCASFHILCRLLESGRIEPADIVTVCTSA